jgi:hypothetical protein
MEEKGPAANVVQLPESKLIIDILDISYIIHPEINKYVIVCKRPGQNLPLITATDLEVLMNYMGEHGMFVQLQAPPKVAVAQ